MGADAIDFAAIAEPVARAILGEPNKSMSSKTELRFGKRGSMSVDLKTGQFYNHSEGTGGGVLWLIEAYKGLKGRDAVKWLVENGLADPQPERNRPAQQQDRQQGERAKIVATYPYVDESGQKLFEVVRLEPKDFRQRRPARPDDLPDKVRNGWVWSVKDIKLVPYRLPELIEARDSGAIIFLVEGEKDSDNLTKLGAPATTGPMGAGKWPFELTAYFEDADVVIIPDNDPQAQDKDGIPRFHKETGRPVFPGQDHAELIGLAILGAAKSVRVLELPGLPLKGDVSDWIDAGGTTDALYDLVESSAIPFEAWVSKRPGAPKIGRDGFVSRYGRLSWAGLDDPGPEYEYLIDDFLTAADKSVIGGPSKSGKSFLAIHAALAVARGTKFFGRPVKPGLVIYQAGEGARGIKKRLRAYRQHFGVPKSEKVAFELLQSQIDIWRADGDTEPLIKEIKGIAALHELPLRLVVIDTLATAIGGADEISGKDMGAVMKNISRINSETGAHVMLVHHMNAEGKKLRGHTSIYANLDQVILVTRDEETKVRTVRLDKQKDDEDGLTFKFELLSTEIGQREDGRAITSCVVVDVGDKKKFIEEDSKRKGFKLRDQETIIFQALLNAIKKYGGQAPSALELPFGTQVVDWTYWRAEYESISFHEAGDDTPEAEKRRQGAIRQAMKRAGESLMKFKVIGRAKPYVWWTGRPVFGFPETFDRDLSGATAAAAPQEVAGQEETPF